VGQTEKGTPLKADFRQQAVNDVFVSGQIIDYQVLNTRSSEELGLQVRKLLQDGWQPYGPMSHTSTWVQNHAYPGEGYNSDSFAQVMVKVAQ
jgi:hypothetical protein